MNSLAVPAKAAYQKRQRVYEDLGQQPSVDYRQRAVGGRQHQQQRGGACREVGHEDPAYAEVGRVEPCQTEGYGQRDVQKDVDRLERDEGHGATLLPEARERYYRPYVQQHDQGNQRYVLGVSFVCRTHGCRQRHAESDYAHAEYDGRERRYAPRRGEYLALVACDIAAGLLGTRREAEIARLHAHRQQHEGEGYQRIDIRDDTVCTLVEYARVVWRKQVVQKPDHDRAYAVYCSLFC